MRHYISSFLLVSGLVLSGCGGKQEPAPSTPETPAPPSTSLNVGAAAPASAPASVPAPGAPTAPTQEIAPAAERLEKGTPAYDVLMHAIQSFSLNNERPPKNLEELITARYLRALPPAPEGKKFQYDPNTQSISIVAK